MYSDPLNSDLFLIVIFVLFVSGRRWTENNLWSTLLQRDINIIGGSIHVRLGLLVRWSIWRIRRWLWFANLDLISHGLDTFTLSQQNLQKMTHRLSLSLLLVIIILSIILIEIFRIVTFGISQCNIWFRFVFGQINRFVQVIIDDVVFAWLLANIFTGWWHADQMDLVEWKSLRANPWMLLIFLAIVKHFTS